MAKVIEKKEEVVEVLAPGTPLKPMKVRNKGKMSRNKRKNARKGGPLSMYVRDKISASEYFRLTGQRSN